MVIAGMTDETTEQLVAIVETNMAVSSNTADKTAMVVSSNMVDRKTMVVSSNTVVRTSMAVRAKVRTSVFKEDRSTTVLMDREELEEDPVCLSVSGFRD